MNEAMQVLKSALAEINNPVFDNLCQMDIIVKKQLYNLVCSKLNKLESVHIDLLDIR
jgi:hypothetical protein